MDEYERLSAGAADVHLADFHSELFKEFLEGDITVQDIAEMLNNEEERDFWEDFRFRYAEYGDDRETMLEALKNEEKDRATKDQRDRKNRADELHARERGRKSGPQEHPREKTPLPEPEVPRSGRGGRKPSGESTNPVIRALGRIGRRIFGRN